MKKIVWFPGYLILGFMYFFPTEWGERRNVAFTNRLWDYRHTIAPVISVPLYLFGFFVLLSIILPHESSTKSVPSTSWTPPETLSAPPAQNAATQQAPLTDVPTASAVNQGPNANPDGNGTQLVSLSRINKHAVGVIDCNHAVDTYERLVCDDVGLRRQEETIVAYVTAASAPDVAAAFSKFREALAGCRMKFCVESTYDDFVSENITARR